MARRGENIHKRKDGRWEARYEKGRTEKGTIIYGFLYGKSYREAKAKKLQALQKQIPLSIHVSLPAELKLEAWNLGVLLGNLLENAFEASEKLPQELRSVKIYAKIAKGNLLITVKNHWNGELTVLEGRIYSTKHEGAGIGLSSVRSMAEANGGQFYLTPDEDEFEVSLVLWKQV